MSITLIAGVLIAVFTGAAVAKARAPKLIPIRIRVRDRL